MLWTRNAYILLKEMEEVLYKKYRIFRVPVIPNSETFIINEILLPKNNYKTLDIPEVYIFYSLRIYDLVDWLLDKTYYFDQLNGGYPSKFIGSDAVDYTAENEIFNIADEFGLKSCDKLIIRHVFTRLRFLALHNIYDKIHDEFIITHCEYENPLYYETHRFKENFKKYIHNHKKYHKYTEFCKKALIQSYYYRMKIRIATNRKEFDILCNDPFIYTILEPYNHLTTMYL